MSAILVVDDNEACRDSLSTALEPLGHPVVCAANGSDGLARLRQGCHPFVILLDLDMPVMDGYDFRVAQSEDARWKEIPVILVSSAWMLPTIAKQLVVAGFLQKPIDLSELLSTVRRFEGNPTKVSS